MVTSKLIATLIAFIGVHCSNLQGISCANDKSNRRSAHSFPDPQSNGNGIMLPITFILFLVTWFLVYLAFGRYDDLSQIKMDDDEALGFDEFDDRTVETGTARSVTVSESTKNPKRR
ncbi:hypothetical protein HDE_13962 [Halotydeus destructor]|nr:hypothetical protein HDE_13962 [Halotydeus destructor]